MPVHLHLTDSAERAWQEICLLWQDDNAVLIVPSDMRKHNFLRQLEQTTFGERIWTIQEFWQHLQRSMRDLPRSLSRTELRVWLHDKLQNDPLLGYLDASYTSQDALIDHLLHIDTYAHATYKPQTQVEHAVARLLILLADEKLVTREGLRHEIAKRAASYHTDKRFIFAPLGIPTPALTQAIDAVGTKHTTDCWYLTNHQVEEKLLGAGLWTNFTPTITRHYSDHTLVGQLFNHVKDNVRTKTKHIQATSSLDAALETAQELILQGAKPKDIGFVCLQDTNTRLHIEQGCENLGIPVLIRQNVCVRDTPLTSFLLALADKTIDVKHMQEQCETYGYTVSKDLLGALAKSSGLVRLAHLYEIAVSLDPDETTTHYLDALLAQIQTYHRLGAPVTDVVQILLDTKSIALLRGDTNGMIVVSFEEAGNFVFNHLIVCSLNADEYPPSVVVSPFLTNELSSVSAATECEFVAALASSTHHVFVRDIFDTSGEQATPGSFWEETRKLALDPVVTFGEENYQYLRRRLRRASREHYNYAKNIDEALLKINREVLSLDTVPMGYFEGTRKRYSVTEIETFLRCPYGWFVQYVLRPVSFERGIRALQGEAMHEIFARAFQDPAQDRALYLEKLWKDTDLDEVFTETEKTVYLQRAKNVAAKYGGAGWPFKEHLVEYKTQGNILELHPEVTISGRVDRIDTNENELLVIDYKNRRALKRPSTGQKLTDLQSTLYPHLAAKQMNKTPLGMIYISIFHADHEGILSKEIPRLANQTTADIYQEQLARALEKASEAITQIQAGEITQIGTNCPPWCAHHMLSQTGQIK